MTYAFQYTEIAELVRRAKAINLSPMEISLATKADYSGITKMMKGLAKPRRETHELFERFVIARERDIFDHLMTLSHIKLRVGDYE